MNLINPLKLFTLVKAVKSWEADAATTSAAVAKEDEHGHLERSFDRTAVISLQFRKVTATILFKATRVTKEIKQVESGTSRVKAERLAGDHTMTDPMTSQMTVASVAGHEIAKLLESGNIDAATAIVVDAEATNGSKQVQTLSSPQSSLGRPHWSVSIQITLGRTRQTEMTDQAMQHI